MDSAIQWIGFIISLVSVIANGFVAIYYTIRINASTKKSSKIIQLVIHFIAFTLSIILAGAISNFDYDTWNLLSKVFLLAYYAISIHYYYKLIVALVYLNEVSPGFLIRTFRLDIVLTKEFFAVIPFIVMGFILVFAGPMLTDPADESMWYNNVKMGSYLFIINGFYVAIEILVKISKIKQDFYDQEPRFNFLRLRAQFCAVLFLICFILLSIIEGYRHKSKFMFHLGGGILALSTVPFSVVYETVQKSFSKPVESTRKIEKYEAYFSDSTLHHAAPSKQNHTEEKSKRDLTHSSPKIIDKTDVPSYIEHLYESNTFGGSSGRNSVLEGPSLCRSLSIKGLNKAASHSNLTRSGSINGSRQNIQVMKRL